MYFKDYEIRTALVAEIELIREALYDLLKKKLAAMNTVNGCLPSGLRQFTPRDFGIPEIEKMLNVIDEEGE